MDERGQRQGPSPAPGGEDRFRATVELAQIGLVHVSLKARWLYVNEHFCRIVGYTREELLTRTIRDLTHPDDRGPDLAQARRLIAGEIESYRLEKRYLHRDGRAVWVDLTASLMRDRTGAPQYLIAVVEDIDARKRSDAALREREARLELLTAAGAILGRSLDLDAALQDVGDLLVPSFADWCVISTLDGEWVERRALRHRDPDGEALLRAWPQRYRLAPDALWGVGRVLWTGQAAFHPRGSIADADPDLAARDPQRVLSPRLGTTSQIVVPLIARGQVLGAINACLSRQDRHYDPADLATLEELARRAALALDNARLYGAEQAARLEAERAASRAARLQSVTATLTQAATREAVAEAALRAGIAAVGAAAGGVGVLTDRGRGIERLAMIGYPEALTAATRLVPLDDMGPIASTARTGEVIWLGTNDELFARYPHLAALPARRQFGATVSVPLMVEGRVIGVMSLRFAEERPLDVELRDLIVAIAGQCAQALERARLFEAEQDARTEAEYLAERLRLAQAAGRIGTFVWDIDADTVAWTPELEALYGLPPGGFGGRYENWRRTLHPEDAAQADRAVRAAATSGFLDVGFRIVRPDGAVRHLLAQARVIHDTDGHAQMVGVNVDVTEREEALAAAEAAVRSRDVFLSIAAHELRTPITALKGSAQLLVRQEARGLLDPARRARTLGVLNDAADRLAALTDDLLDVSRIRTGQLPLTLAPLDLAALVVDAIAHARERNTGPHRLRLAVPEDLPRVPGDAARLEQVLTNLLDNAIKYAPDGGDIGVSLVPHDGGVLASVRDQGIGLPPGSAEAIFEPFGRAPNAAQSQLPGLGLGLYICRSIIERHGGRIWAESDGEGLGTTVSLWLPGEAAAPGG